MRRRDVEAIQVVPPQQMAAPAAPTAWRPAHTRPWASDTYDTATDPLVRDTDGDGVDDARDDTDGDGLGNLDVGWLNSRGNQVEVEKEKEIMIEAREVLRQMLEKDGPGQDVG